MRSFVTEKTMSFYLSCPLEKKAKINLWKKTPPPQYTDTLEKVHRWPKEDEWYKRLFNETHVRDGTL